MESKSEDAKPDSEPKEEVKNEPTTKLTKIQDDIIKAIEAGNIEDFKKLLDENLSEDLNFVDDFKMTPLQHACYRGNKEMVKILIEKGVNVNKCEHDNDYTSLHFAALSGSVDVCHQLLAAGASVFALNSVNRTASQMAAFVGHHNVVCTINNFIPKSDVDYFTKPQGTQATPYLNCNIANSVYKFALLYNFHPVKIAMLLQSYKGLIEHIDEVKKVFELMSEREMKRKDTNEVLSFKFYYISYIVGEIGKMVKSKKEHNINEEKSFVEMFAKKLLKTNKAGDLEFMNVFIKEGVRGFPFIDSTLFRQMVVSLANENSCAALSIISAAVNGQRAFAGDSGKCTTCGEEKPPKKCAKCKNVSYCDRECQRLHWFMHKKECARLGQTTSEEKKVDHKEVSEDIHNVLASSNN